MVHDYTIEELIRMKIDERKDWRFKAANLAAFTRFYIAGLKETALKKPSESHPYFVIWQHGMLYLYKMLKEALQTAGYSVESDGPDLKIRGKANIVWERGLRFEVEVNFVLETALRNNHSSTFDWVVFPEHLERIENICEFVECTCLQVPIYAEPQYLEAVGLSPADIEAMARAA